MDEADMVEGKMEGASVREGGGLREERGSKEVYV